MRFSTPDNIYPVIRLIGLQDNILAISFAEKDRSDNHLGVIECYFPKIERKSTLRFQYKIKIQSSKERLSWNKLWSS